MIVILPPPKQSNFLQVSNDSFSPYVYSDEEDIVPIPQKQIIKNPFPVPQQIDT